MQVIKLDDVDAFVVSDLDGHAPSTGVVRAARKVLRDGAVLLARAETYTYAVAGRKVGGASGGLNATGEGRSDAVAALVEALRPLVADGRFLPTAAKGLGASELAPLRDGDPRPALWWELRDELDGLGAAVAAEAVVPLDGARVAIEGLMPVGVALARAAAERGAKVVAISTNAGGLLAPGGLDASELAAAWDEHGADLVEHLPGDKADAAAVLAAEAEVLAAGSKAGVVDHLVAADVQAKVLVPSGPVPVTARGLATLRAGGCEYVPDVVAFVGSARAAFPDEGDPGDAEGWRSTVAELVAGLAAEAAAHDEGAFMGACVKAEAFLSTWQDELPWGRPLA